MPFVRPTGLEYDNFAMNVADRRWIMGARFHADGGLVSG